jgi:hypothetical protein
MRQTILMIAGLLFVGLASGAITPCNAGAGSPQAEPTKDDCMAAVRRAHSLAAALPDGDLSRYFAERNLHQALVEAGNGEFDDCMEMAKNAIDEVKERRHVVKPGETFKVLRADE